MTSEHLEVIEQAKRQFRKQLMSSQELMRREAILRGVGNLKNDIVALTPDNMLNGHYAKAIKEIYDALPQDMRGRWQVGNTKLTRGQGKMAKANQLTNTLLDAIFKNELKDEFSSFKSLAQEFDAINIEDQGVMHKGQRKWSENKEDELRKRLANQLYKHLKQLEDPSLRDIDKNLVELRKQFNKPNQQSKVNQSKQASSPKEKNFDTYSSNSNILTKSKQIGVGMPILGRSFNKISRLWRQDIRAEINAERQFLRNQKNVEQEKPQEEYESEISRGL
ncbi:relaxase MobL [Leuconostoc citreum]|uniref:relaxase MobL n=1 Tax=Leuconostoc citreum TaxID=33964 RepID=UPI001D046539|nr:relaxase MobL [Leuconostoc citreum]